MNYVLSLQSIVTASIGLFASVLAVSLTYFFTKKHQLKMEERRLKEEFYKSFINAMNNLLLDNDKDKYLNEFSDAVNSLYLIAGTEVVNALY